MNILFWSFYIIYFITIIIFNVINFNISSFFNNKLDFGDWGIFLLNKKNLEIKSIFYYILIGLSFIINLIYLKLFRKKENRKKSRRLIKKGTLQSVIYLLNDNIIVYNFVSFLTKIMCIFFISLNNGIIIFPVIFLIFVDMVLSLKNKFKIKQYIFWGYWLKFLIYYSIILLILIYFENLNIIKLNLSKLYREIIGNLELNNLYDLFKIINIVVLLLISKYNLILQLKYINLLKNKENLNKNKFTYYLKIHNGENFIILFFKKISLLLVNNSYKITQICLILWGLSRTSLIMFFFVLSGMIGIIISDKNFKKYLIKIVLLFGFLYIISQIIYNMSFFLIENKNIHLYEKIFFIIGIYRYENIQNGSLVIKNYKLSELEIIRMKGLLVDLFSYLILYILFLILSEKKEANDLELSISQIESKDIEISFFNYYFLIFSNYFKFFVINNIKFCFVFSLWFLSIINYDLIHLVYLICFITIFFNYTKVKNEIFINFFLYYSALIIIIIYIYKSFRFNVDNNIEEVIGIINKNKSFIYYDHIIIFLVCYLIKKEKNKENSNFSMLFKLNEKEEEIYNDNLKKFDSIVKFLRYLLISKIFYLHIFGIILFIFFKSFNFSALIFCIFYIYLFTFKIFKEKLIFRIKFNMILFKILNFFLIGIILLRYICYLNLKFFNNFLNNISIYLKFSIGYNNIYPNDLIISAGILFFIFSIHIKLFQDEQLIMDVIDYEKDLDLKESNPKKFKYYLYFIYVIYKQLEGNIYPLFYIFIVFILSLFLKNLIGIIILIILMTNIIRDRENSWSNVWFSIYCFICFCFILQYVLLLFYFEKIKLFNNIINFIGFYYDDENLKLNFISYILIMLFSLKFALIKNTNSFILNRKKLKRLVLYYKNNNIFNNVNDYKKYVNNDLEDIEKNSLEIIKNNLKNFHNYYYDLPKILGNKFIHKLKNIFNYFVNEMTIIMMLISGFFSLNLFSFVLFFFGIYFYYKITCIYKLKHNINEIKKFMIIWIIFSIIFSIYSLYNYFINIFEESFLNEQFKIQFSFFCDKTKNNVFSVNEKFKNVNDYENCIDEWTKFFNIKGYGMSSLILDFSILLFLIFSMLRQTDYLNSIEKTFSDFDITIYENKNLTEYLTNIIFIYLPSICLIIFFFIGIIDDHGDIISILYFLFSSFIIINSYFYKKKKKFKVFKLLEIFNIIIIGLFLFYQAPIFSCPILNKERYFYSKLECKNLLDKQNEIYKFDNSPSKIFSFYVISINTMGLKKIGNYIFFNICKLTFMLIFLFLGMIQKHIWNENKFLKIEDKYQEDRKYLFMKTINYLICFYEQKVWKYYKKQSQNLLLKRKQLLIDKKIINWEKILKNKNLGEEEIREENTNLNESNINNYYDINQTNENVIKLIDSIILKFSDYEPILFINEVEEIVKNNISSALDLENSIKKKQEEKRKEYINHIINLNELNLKEVTFELKNNNVEEILLNEEYNYLFRDEEHENSIEEDDSSKNLDYSNLIDINENIETIDVKWDFSNFLKILNKKIKEKLITFIDRGFIIHHNKFVINQDTKFFKIIELLFKSYTFFYIGIAFFFNVLFNTNLLSIFLLITYLIYASVEYPFPHKNYFKFCISYIFIILILKMLYQTPLFCGNPEFTLIFSSKCNFAYINENSIYKRWDIFIGIYKFYGYASIPKNKGVFLGILGDFVCLIFILIHRWNLKNLGLWNYLWINENKRIFPQLNVKSIVNKIKNIKNIKSSSKITVSENIDNSDYEEREKINNNILEEPNENVDLNVNNVEKSKKNKIVKYFKYYYLKMFPYFNNIPKEKSNANKKFNYNNPLEKIKYEPLFIKNGIEIYTYLVIFEIIIMIFFMLFYSNLNGSSVSFKQGLDKSRFSGNLVLTIIFIIILICFNRISYKLKFNKYNHKIKIKNEIEQKMYYKKSIKNFSLLFRYLLHIFLIVFIFYYLFIKVPTYNRKIFDNIIVAQICFVIFFIYLLLNAIQIKHGYTDSMKIHAFTENFGLFNKVGVRVFKIIPFIYEIKNVIDWTITSTSLDLFQWFKLEDAYIILFLCKNQMKIRLKKKFGQPIFLSYKIFMGWCFIFFLILIIVLPMLLFSTLNPNYILNNPYTGSYNIEIWTNLKDNNIKSFKVFEINNIIFNKINKEEFSLLKKNDIQQNIGISQFQTATLTSFSENLWNISPPNYQNLIKLLNFDLTDFYITANWKFKRNLPTGNENSIGSNTIPLSKDEVKKISDILNNKSNDNELIWEYLNPSIVKLNSQKFNNIKIQENLNEKLKNTKIKLKYFDSKDGKYWQILDLNDKNIKFFLRNELVIGNFFGASIKNIGIIGFYITIVFAIGKLIRGIFDQIIMKVIYEEMPNTDDLIDFCDSIYLSRKEGDLKREQKWFDLLIRIYRSPEILLQLTNNFLDYDNLEEKKNK